MVYECWLRLAVRLKSGGPSLGRSPDAHKQRRLVNQDQTQIFEVKGSTQFLSRALCPALFLFEHGIAPCSLLNRSNELQIASADMITPSNPIERSFEIAAERCDDLTPLVYRRLHAEHPETLSMFRTQGSEPVKGSMLALTIDAMLDFAGPRTGHFRMIECEVSSHDAYGTPRELFIAFFGVIAGTLRELLGADWSPEIDIAWRKLLEEIEAMVSQCTT
jgi:hemoglobin-like flavoprotein